MTTPSERALPRYVDDGREWLEKEITEAIARFGSCDVASECLEAYGVRVVADMEDRSLSIVRRFPEVLMRPLITGDLKLPNSPSVARFAGPLGALQAACTRHGWLCYPYSAANALARFVPASPLP